MNMLFDISRDQLKALAEYKSVLETGSFFPRNFWQKEKKIDGIRPGCQVITRYCLEHIQGILPEALPSYSLKTIKEIFIKNHLHGMVQTVFNHNIILVLKNAYPAEFKARKLSEWMWSSHGLWQNDEFVIEAVQHMVLKEGIRRVELIPGTNWKKRLKKYGIYNILSRFHWSVFGLFDFVYPGRFHPADFRYKTKWKTGVPEVSLKNAYRAMAKAFQAKQLSRDRILLLNCSGFRDLGLISMLLSVFGGKTLNAKEFYLYGTIGNEDSLQSLKNEIKLARSLLEDDLIRNRLASVATGKYIYNLHTNSGAYSYLKRQAEKRGLDIRGLAAYFGYIYKNNSPVAVDPQEIWKLRQKGLTYIEIADRLGSNPTTISNICRRHFGQDPLIPRPIEDYITIQELMDEYHIDHKTIMKLVSRNNLENHMTIRHRYLKKSEIIPIIMNYKKKNLQHRALINRYTVHTAQPCAVPTE